MENTISGTEVTPIPPQRGEAVPPSSRVASRPVPAPSSPREAAARYAEDLRWQVVPGVSLETTAGVVRCSCGDASCPLPGAHPEGPDWAGRATSSGAVVRRLWGARPDAAVLLPTGRSFDVLEVSETAGFLALARLERLGPPEAAGPVLLTPDGRMRFLVLPGAVASVAREVRAPGRSPERLDLVAMGDGGWITAPPTRHGSRGPAQWVRAPFSHSLPEAAALLPALTYASTR